MNGTPEGISGIVLAGGQGRRMGGVDKGLEPLRGKPMVQWVLGRLEPQVDEVLINANQNLEAYARFSHRVVTDEVGGFAGPLAGLASGMKAARQPLVVTVPCDSPFLPLDLVARLRTALDAGAAVLAVAKTGAQSNPVFALARRSLLADLEAFLAAGGRKIDAWYAPLKVVEVQFDDQTEAFSNINTRHELAEFESDEFGAKHRQLPRRLRSGGACRGHGEAGDPRLPHSGGGGGTGGGAQRARAGARPENRARDRRSGARQLGDGRLRRALCRPRTGRRSDAAGNRRRVRRAKIRGQSRRRRVRARDDRRGNARRRRHGRDPGDGARGRWRGRHSGRPEVGPECSQRGRGPEDRRRGAGTGPAIAAGRAGPDRLARHRRSRGAAQASRGLLRHRRRTGVDRRAARGRRGLRLQPLYAARHALAPRCRNDRPGRGARRSGATGSGVPQGRVGRRRGHHHRGRLGWRSRFHQAADGAARRGAVLEIAMRPGRPMAFGRIGSAALFGLPGNPVAVMVTFYQFVREALLYLSGRTDDCTMPLLKVPSASALRKLPGRTEFQRGILSRDARGEWSVRLTGQQGAGVLRSMSEANCFVVLEHARGNVAAGELVGIQLMDGLA